MTIQLSDKTAASFRLLRSGQCKLTFHGIDKAMILPVGTEVNVSLIERLYSALKDGVAC